MAKQEAREEERAADAWGLVTCLQGQGWACFLGKKVEFL